MHRFFLTLSLVIFFIPLLMAQVDSSAMHQTYKLTVEDDVLTLKIKNMEDRKTWSAARSSENVFETIASSSIITDEEIKRSGAISIAEALRLLPGVFVREKTNGNFSVHIGGGENINNDLSNYENTNALLTINGIPFNDTYQGGIFWETVPVAMIDIKQIEVVRTGSSALYGRNALSGVINIVTKMTDTKYLKAHGNFQGGSHQVFSHQANASFAAANKGLFKISAFYNSRDRFQDAYYIAGKNSYISSDSLLFYQPDVERTNSFTHVSMSNFGVDGFGTWQVNSEVNVEAMISNVNSDVQSVLQGLNQLMLSGRKNQSTRVALKSKIYGLNTAISYQKNMSDLAVGYDGFELLANKWYASADYAYRTPYTKLQIGGTFQYDTYLNGYAQNEATGVAYLNKVVPGKSRMVNYGIHFSPIVYAFGGKLKSSAILRTDYLQRYNKVHVSYQLGALYKLSKRSLLRSIFSTGYQPASLMQYQYAENIAAEFQADLHTLAYESYNYEIGFRTKPVNELSVDLTLFDNEGRRYSVVEQEALDFTRRGFTLSTALSLSKFKARGFLSYLYTNAWSDQVSEAFKLHPDMTGGISSSYSMFLNKLVVGANAYFYDQYVFQELDRNIALPGKTLLDCRISYNIFGEYTIYATGKNILYDTGREFPYADQVGRTFLIGVDLVF